jgi:hypothetical protein
LAPLLPISNRTVKRLRANDSVHTYVKVGHRQTPYKVNAPPGISGEGLLLYGFNSDLLERSDNTRHRRLLRRRLTFVSEC